MENLLRRRPLGVTRRPLVLVFLVPFQKLRGWMSGSGCSDPLHKISLYTTHYTEYPRPSFRRENHTSLLAPAGACDPRCLYVSSSPTLAN